jgi:hypothetical protein
MARQRDHTESLLFTSPFLVLTWCNHHVMRSDVFLMYGYKQEHHTGACCGCTTQQLRQYYEPLAQTLIRTPWRNSNEGKWTLS